MTIALVWFWDQAEDVWNNYRDGVKASMEVLQKRGHTVKWYRGVNPLVDEDTDFILMWGDSKCQAFEYVRPHKARKGLLLTTDLGMDIESLRKYDVVFAEVQYIADALKAHGIHAVKAFGTDTEFFKSSGRYREYKAFYPSTFSPWKRNNVFAKRWGKDGLCLGTIQPDGWDILKETVALGTNVFIGYLPVERVRDLYDRCKLVHIAGYEGSGRTVIEAMSMGLDVIAEPDNLKCQSYLQEFKDSGLTPRGFAEKFYSAEVYADQILKGINA